MKIVIKFRDEVFSAADELIIGRGAPFDIIRDNKTISREHALIKIKDKKTYIKDLGSFQGTFLNDNKLVSDKFYEVKSSDTLYIGDEPLELLDDTSIEVFEEVSLISNKKESNKIFIKYMMFGYILTTFIALSTYQEILDKEYDGLLHLIFILAGHFLFQTLFTLILVIPFYLMTKLFNRFDKNIKNISMSKKGMTIFYEDSNISFNLEDIVSYQFIPIYSYIVIKAHDEKYLIRNFKHINYIHSYLEKNIPHKNESMNNLKLLLGFLIGFLGFIALISTDSVKLGELRIDNFFHLIMAIFYGYLLLEFSLICFDKNRNKFLFKSFQPTFSFKKIRKNALLILPVFGCFFYFSANNFYQIAKNSFLLSECKKGNTTSCNKIDEYYLSDIVSRKNRVNEFQKVCDAGNSKVCKSLEYYKRVDKGRMPASKI
jgi:hypothetical protein